MAEEMAIHQVIQQDILALRGKEVVPVRDAPYECIELRSEGAKHPSRLRFFFG